MLRDLCPHCRAHAREGEAALQGARDKSRWAYRQCKDIKSNRRLTVVSLELPLRAHRSRCAAVRPVAVDELAGKAPRSARILQFCRTQIVTSAPRPPPPRAPCTQRTPRAAGAHHLVLEFAVDHDVLRRVESADLLLLLCFLLSCALGLAAAVAAADAERRPVSGTSPSS